MADGSASSTGRVDPPLLPVALTQSHRQMAVAKRKLLELARRLCRPHGASVCTRSGAVLINGGPRRTERSIEDDKVYKPEGGSDGAV